MQASGGGGEGGEEEGQGVGEGLECDGLGEEAIHARLDRLGHRVLVVAAAEHDQRGRVAAGAEPRGEREAVHFGHLHVADDHVRPARRFR